MIPVSEPWLTDRELKYVSECVRTGWVSSAGRFISEFEDRWSAYCGRQHGVAVSSGTAALQLAVASLDLAPGTEIILPTFTMISCALAVVRNQCTPIFVDADPDTWCIDVLKIEEKITNRTRAIMPVHIYGHPVQMDAVLRLSERYGLAILEDAAEAHGAEYLSVWNDSHQWRRCGSFGRMSCFSFYGNKLVTTGEGGMILTDDLSLAERLRSLRNLCFQPGRRFSHEELGYNFRLTNLQAALGVAQVERMDEILAKKRWIGQEYTKRLRHLSALQLPEEAAWAKQVYWMYGIVLSDKCGIEASEFARRLAARGVETRPFFLGMHEQPVFKNKDAASNGSFPVAERLARKGLYLPSGTALTAEQIDEVVDKVGEVLTKTSTRINEKP